MLGGAKKKKEPLKLPDQSPDGDHIKHKLRRIESATISHAHRFIISRWKNLQEVRRHALAWLFLIVIMSAAVVWQSSKVADIYNYEVPNENTVYTEGVFGSVDNFNPVFVSSQAERSISRLLFSSLLKYNEQGQLVGDLVSSWKRSSSGKIYDILLRDDIRWHDDTSITADDVVYTFSVIKDADSRSPLYSSWRNIGVKKVNDRVVRFTLPTAYSPFPNSLTIGIIPKHILGELKPSQLRNNIFNTTPTVGSGPFVFQDMRALDTDRTRFIVRLSSNDKYFAGSPKLSRFNIQTFSDRDQLIQSFKTQEVAAVSDLSTEQLEQIPEKANTVVSESPLYNAVYAFMKTDSPFLKDKRVRRALQYATNRTQLIEKLNNRFEPATSPLLPGQLGYRSDLRQSDDRMSEAAALLDKAGWKMNENGRRVKNGQVFKIQIATVSEGDYPVVVQELIDQWSRLGITFESQLIRSEDIQQNIIAPRVYDVLIYEIAIGRDPDVFAYWHSSQANERGFNLSNYKSGRIDDLLDSARSTPDSKLRETKYKSFIDKWLEDTPAIGLYRPSMSYVQNSNITNFTPRPLAEQINRYFNVLYWSSSKSLMNPTL